MADGPGDAVGEAQGRVVAGGAGDGAVAGQAGVEIEHLAQLHLGFGLGVVRRNRRNGRQRLEQFLELGVGVGGLAASGDEQAGQEEG
ncbi:hypothetical protein SDC9_202639 [bioreactor metagenome]|uniref:Uncharacterized protein n=1 Tax=bioreactor metagenome TaxID=1076179 RepID=A0A645IVP8_9ZZZZ